MDSHGSTRRPWLLHCSQSQCSPHEAVPVASSSHPLPAIAACHHGFPRTDSSQRPPHVSTSTSHLPMPGRAPDPSSRTAHQSHRHFRRLLHEHVGHVRCLSSSLSPSPPTRVHPTNQKEATKPHQPKNRPRLREWTGRAHKHSCKLVRGKSQQQQQQQQCPQDPHAPPPSQTCCARPLGGDSQPAHQLGNTSQPAACIRVPPESQRTTLPASIHQCVVKLQHSATHTDVTHFLLPQTNHAVQSSWHA